ncbi:HD domain-containing protein [bacterium]|nr:HD domain-containing protein [bacterium]
MKKLYVANLQEGARIEEVFLVVSKSVANTRTGSQFLKMTLADKTGTVDSVKWDVSEADVGRISEDDYIHVQASVKSYNDHPQLVIESFQRWGDAIDPADFLRSSPRNPDEMSSELSAILAQVTNPNLRSLLDSFFSDNEYSAKFKQAPAAKKLHHAYIGGLLEHTLNVVRTCAALADLYPNADRELLLTGAALHDIGKVDEYLWSSSIKFSNAGHLVGHVVGGAMMVKAAADAIDSFDPMMSLALQHMIISHHGTKEWGSPKLPKSIEALILHCADYLDAHVAIFEEAIQSSGSDGLFTERHFLLERPIFKGLHGSAEVFNGLGQVGEPVLPSGEAVDLENFAVEDDYDPFADE